VGNVYFLLVTQWLRIEKPIRPDQLLQKVKAAMEKGPLSG
jgi:hypothetical protein